MAVVLDAPSAAWPGRRLRAARIRASVEVPELALVMGVTATRVYQIERQEMVRPEMVNRMLIALALAEAGASRRRGTDNRRPAMVRA